MELRHLLRVAQRRWWIPLLGTVIAAVTAFMVSQQLTPIYQARATLLLNLAQQPVVPTYQDVTASQALTKTYARLITSRPVLEEAARRIGSGVTAESLKRVAGSSEPETQLLYITYRDKDPAFAATVVNVVAQVFAERVKAAQLGEVAGQDRPSPPSSVNTIFIAEPASIPTLPTSPNIPLNTAFAALAGLFLSIGIVALLEYLDDTVKDAHSLQAMNLPFLGNIRQASGRRNGSASLIDPAALRSPLAEDYRQLRTYLEFMALSGDTPSLLVTSVRPGEGKTTVLCNLAIVLASTGKRVIVVDCDLRKPAVHRFFDLPNTSGLTTAFIAPAGTFDSLLKVGPVDNLQVLTSGPWTPPDPAQLLASPRMAEIMERLATRADVVLYDSPPVLGFADAAVLAARVHAAFLVIEVGRNRPGTIRLALDTLQRAGARVLGGVLNRATTGDEPYYYYDYRPSHAHTASTDGDGRGQLHAGSL